MWEMDRFLTSQIKPKSMVSFKYSVRTKLCDSLISGEGAYDSSPFTFIFYISCFTSS